MKSIGYGAYGTFGSPADLLTGLLNTGANVLSSGLGIVFEPVDVLEPAELKGAKLSKGFKIITIQTGTAVEYKIVPNLGPLSSLTSIALPAELSRFAGVAFDPTKDFETALAGGKIVYIAPPNYTKVILAAVGALVVVITLFKVLR